MGFLDFLSGGIGDLLGTNSHFQANHAPISSPVTGDQIQGGMNQVQAGFGQQNDLANILRQQALGQGINPAQNMLNQATAQNVANQAAIAAGQRGVGSNAGLVSRNAANQGANIQQQAIGQGATMGAQQQLGAIGQLQNQQALQSSGALQNQGQLLNAQGGFNSNLVNDYGNVNQINAGVAAGNAQRNSQIVGGAFQGAAAAMPYLAHGGEVDHLSHVANCYYDGGKVPAMVSPGEKYVNPEDAKRILKGEKSLANAGEKIRGHAKVKGDSEKNDVVKKNLDEGGIVIPRSVMQSDDPVKAGTKFLLEAMKKHKGHESDFKVALKKAAASRSK